MPSLLRRAGFLVVLTAGAALFGAGVQGVREMDTSLQLAAQRGDERPALVRYDDPRDDDCPEASSSHYTRS
jgi:hypothetical protein